MKKIKKIGILTSGGDSPGMNKALATIVEESQKHGWEAYVIINGYKGLYENKIRLASHRLVLSQANLAGSCILSSRFPQFKDDSVADVAAKNAKDAGLDVIFVLGGNGSFAGSKKLRDRGINVMDLPCTIDNDVAGTQFTIGFDSALSACVDTVDMLRATADTHGNTMLVEIMGRKCSDLTIATSLATEVDYIITPYNVKTPDEIVEIVKKIKQIPHKKAAMILITELIYTGKDGEQIALHDLKKYVEEKTKIPTKTHVIGFVQRGAHPTAIERYNASRMARHAVNLAAQGKLNLAIGIDGNDMVETSIDANFDRVENKAKVEAAIKLINRVDYK